MPARRAIAPSVPFLALLALGLAASCVAGIVPSGGGTPGAAYEVVELSGKAYQASSLAVTRSGMKVVTPGGLRELLSADIDWYTTFRRNVASGATNVVVFKNGALLRFDRYEDSGGAIKLTTSGGGQVSVAESLIDFQASVREGAMVRLPEGAGSAVAVSSGSSAGGGQWSEDDGGAGGPGGGDDPAVAGAARSRRPGSSLVSRRRAAALAQAQGGTPDDSAAGGEPQPEMPPEDTAAPMDTQPPGSGGEDTGGGGSARPPFGRRGPLSRPSSGGQQGGQESGQAVVTVTTDYSGPIGGLQLTLAYPTNLQLVEPVSFTGFAGNWLATPNTTVPGQIVIAGAAPPGSSIGGGEFLRVTFVWNGTAPQRQQFKLASLQVSGPDSNPVTDFRATLDVQTSP